MRFVDFPTDILFYLLGYLELDDALILLSTCTSLRKLSANRSLWITILARIQANGSRPLACPIQQNFSQLSLSDLQKIAHHTVRLEKNWSREDPRIMGPVSTIECEGVNGPLCILSVIPGMKILVLCDRSQLFCYDLLAATSSPPLRIGGMYCYAHFDEYGKRFIGAVHKIEHAYYHLDIFCVEYGPGTPPILRRVYQKVNPAHMRRCFDLFMNAGIVGMIYRDTTSDQVYLLVMDIHTSASLTVPLSGFDVFQSSFDHFSCLMQGSYVYIGVQTDSCTCHLLRCDISTPWDDDNTDGRLSPPVTIEPFDPRQRGQQRFQPTSCQLLQPLGLTALYSHTHTHSNAITTSFIFQPDIFASFRQTDILRLDLAGYLQIHHPYSFSTDSGNYLLLCTEPKADDDSDDEIEEDVDPQPEFYLVHFVKGPPASITARQLKMPDFIEEELVHDRIQSVIVDDHIGVVYLTSEGGYISAIPFA